MEESIGLDKYAYTRESQGLGNGRTEIGQRGRPGLLRDYRYMKLEPVLEEDEVEAEDDLYGA